MHDILTPAAVASLLAPLGRYGHVLLAVSGGADSSALMHMSSACCAAMGVTPAISVATVDHDLRPSSAAEAESVARAACALGLPHTVLRWAGAKPSRGIEEAARAARYGLLAGHAHAIGAEAIVTAHTLDDQAETVLMRLARGSGVDGLSAMASDTELAGLRLLRPLLGVRKAQLVAWLRQAGRSWIEDEANADASFERVRLRKAQAALSALGLTPAALGRTAARMARARAALETSADAWILQHARFAPCGFATATSAPLLALSDEIAVRVLERLVAAVGGKAFSPSLMGLERLLKGLRESPGRTATFAGCRIQCTGNDCRLTRELRREGIAPLALRPGESGLWDGRFRVGLSRKATVPVEVRALGQEGVAQIAPALQDVPKEAALACAAFWQDDTLLASPPLGWRNEAAPPVFAEFLHH